MGTSSRSTVNSPRPTQHNARGIAMAALLGALVWVICTIAEAQAPSEPAAYGQAIDEAVAAYDAGDFERARERFAEAHAVFANARTLRGLGKAEFELRNYGQSLAYLQASLASDQKPLDDRLREEVSALVQRARACVVEVHVLVEPDNAADAVPAPSPEAPSAATTPLSAFLTGREERPTRAGAPLRRSAWLWTAVGVVAAGVAVGLVFGLQPDQKAREAGPISTPNTPPGSTIQTLRAR